MHKDFKMKKETKRMLALLKFKNEDARNLFKRAMISAQVSADYAIKENKKAKVKDKDGE